MRKLLLLSMLLSALLLLSPANSRAQYVVTGQGCGASGLNAIANDGTPVVCRGNPLVWTAVGGTTSGGITSVASLPGTCTVGQQTLLANAQGGYLLFTCGPVNVWNSSNAPGGVVDPMDFGAKFNGKAFFSNVNTCSWTSGQATFTCTGANFCDNVTFMCATGQIPDAGKQFTATVNSCCGSQANYLGAFAIPNLPTTIISIQSATQATISRNFTSNSGANWIVAWATNDDAAITAAETAWKSGNKCGSMQLAAGITAVLKGHWQDPGANCLGMEPQADYTAAVYGQGNGATVIGLFAGFNAGGECATNPNQANTCFGGFKENVMYNLQFNGFGGGNTGFGVATQLLAIGLGGQWSQVACNAFGGSDSNLTGIGFAIGARQWGMSIDGCGGAGGLINGGIVKFYYCFFGDNSGPALSFNPASDLTDFGCDYGSQGGTSVLNMTGGATYRGIGSNLFGCGNTNASGILANNTTATIILDQARFNCTSTTSNGIYANQNSKIILSGGTVIGGTSTDIAVSSTTSLYIDTSTTLIHNTISGTAPIFADGHSLTGACTGVATASQTLGLYGTGPNVTATTCTSTTIGSGIPITGARTAMALRVSASVGGVNSSSGVVTVLKNGGPTAITCTLGTGTSCSDGTHSVAFGNGDLISFNFTTQAGETLAGVKAEVIWL